MPLENDTALEIGAKIDAGLDPIEITEGFLDAIDRHEHRDLIYARTSKSRALEEAKAASERAKQGRRLGPLDGVPISWKDLFDTKDIVTEAGSKLLEGRLPRQDCEVLEHVSAAGLICLGKTTMPELAFSGLGLNPVTGTPPNIHGADKAPGGSSSGAATSVAFGLAAAAIGSDTGGSARIPPAWNDLTGFKPSHGNLSVRGVVPLCAKFDTVGPIGRDVRDVAALYDAMAGRQIRTLQAADLSGLKIGICTTSALDDLDDPIAEAFETSQRAITAAGAELGDMTCPDIADALGLSGILFTTEAYGTWKHQIEAAPEKMYHEILARFRSGASHLGSDYVAAWNDLNCYRVGYAEAASSFDAIILPTSATLPPDMSRLSSDTEYYKRANLLSLRNTRIGNLMGLCAITLPTSTDSCGLMIMGLSGADQRLLQIAAGIETALKR